MQRITEEQIFKTVDEEQVLDYTIKRTWNDEAVTIDGEEVIQSELLETLKTMADGTILSIVEGDGYVSQMQVYPAIEPPEPQPTLEDKLNALASQMLTLMGV